jgi:hypothetical protein
VEADHEAHAQLGTLYSREDLPLYNLYKAVEHLETVLITLFDVPSLTSLGI